MFAMVTGLVSCSPPGKLAELVWWWSNWEEEKFGLKEDSPGVGGPGGDAAMAAWRVYGWESKEEQVPGKVRRVDVGPWRLNV